MPITWDYLIPLIAVPQARHGMLQYDIFSHEVLRQHAIQLLFLDRLVTQPLYANDGYDYTTSFENFIHSPRLMLHKPKVYCSLLEGLNSCEMSMPAFMQELHLYFFTFSRCRRVICLFSTLSSLWYWSVQVRFWIADLSLFISHSSPNRQHFIVIQTAHTMSCFSLQDIPLSPIWNIRLHFLSFHSATNHVDYYEF